MKIRFSELFYSVQGEGLFVGTPSIFLRTFGCNFTCAGFGMSSGELSREREKIDPRNYQSLSALPLVDTGCDSYASWDPRFKNFTQDMRVSELAKLLSGLSPEKRWLLANNSDIHLVITGGEPLLGWQNAYLELLEQPLMKDLKNITFETNGTQKLNPKFENYLNSTLSKRCKITFSCSPKLSISGEKYCDAIKPEVIKQYFQINNSTLFFKFVVSKKNDLEEVEKVLKEYNKVIPPTLIYIMPVGGKKDGYQEKSKEIIEAALERGFRYSPRIHLDLWNNAWGC